MRPDIDTMQALQQLGTVQSISGGREYGAENMIDVSDLIRCPFVSRGRDPKTGLDCWGLVLEVGRRFGLNLPDFYVDAHDSRTIDEIRKIALSEFAVVERSQSGAIVGLRLDRGCLPDITQHYGMCLDKIRFIHTMDGVDAVISRVDHRFFRNLITGYYVWKG